MSDSNTPATTAPLTPEADKIAADTASQAAPPAPPVPSSEEADLASLPYRIARGETTLPPDAESLSVVAAHKNLNCKGRGPWWYRMVYRNGAWVYFSDERLPMGTFRAAERRATVSGDVYLGEITCDHDKGGPVSDMAIVDDPEREGDEVLTSCPFRKRRDGQLVVTLPDGSEVVVPNPRQR